MTACEAPPHPRPCCRGRVWRSFDTDLESRVFEAPFASLVFNVKAVVGTFNFHEIVKTDGPFAALVKMLRMISI